MTETRPPQDRPARDRPARLRPARLLRSRGGGRRKQERGRRVERVGRLGARDVVRVGAAGLRARPLRVVLSALGIAIGIAAMIGVVGISTSSRAQLQATLDRLGTNLLTVTPGKDFFGSNAQLPLAAPGMIARMPEVSAAAATGKVTDTHVYRNDHMDPEETGGISVLAADLKLPQTIGLTLRSGTWLNAATGRYPAVVLGSAAADRLGVAGAGVQVWLGGRWFTVVGVLNTNELAPELDSAALIGWDAAVARLGFDGHATTVYTRANKGSVERAQGLLAATANPESPNEIEVSRPSDALAAEHAANQTFTALLLGLGGVALLVGGVGVANTMVISVLERRAEIGLRRSLGATRGQIRLQFLTESQLLAALGGLGGVALGALVTFGFAVAQGWPTVVPPWAMVGGLAATLVIGAIAGLYPAIRAARLPPTEALTTP
ncbi:ABC transporter permease [Actinomadura rupiterrae]|uniref:ABC transporter permease n=1 Tax=Actinomadura rupiterrae TaxID=559627 RepID=UPI0020A3CD54|nr:ABC transporter permease [Actinomadura rupiterrae]MCP2340354.1 putative ABC transport system permease protein [Actinomadura rupiterrae]